MPEEQLLEEVGGEAGREEKPVTATPPVEGMDQAGAATPSEVAVPPHKIEHHESLPEKIEGKYHELLAKILSSTKKSPAVSDDALVKEDAKSIAATVDEASKVQKLLDLASAKGVAHAVQVARNLGDYYALDKMHDELVDKLYQGLVERGLVEKE